MVAQPSKEGAKAQTSTQPMAPSSMQQTSAPTTMIPPSGIPPPGTQQLAPGMAPVGGSMTS
eukprot:CAMPEP_0170493876 /NCGR_PEP_ID=MMETSP0208-20121228/14321_1 /TAXON_ID=197538 /ORGANISM="Strombidium inclinatum, Strain S3" /LENGTH=60 /DNA_ID=CAMNT_0010769857 /DNA_START=1047 /DNA_END=1229 /DNA_ORIENTATION=-